MSDDIVERLRNRRGTITSLCDDAADEIERLRGMLDAQKGRTAEVAQLCKETTDRLVAERNEWKHRAEEYFYTDPDCECPMCDEMRTALNGNR